MGDATQMDFFPTAEEILNDVPKTTCDECGEQFGNSSACRFHTLKMHPKSETTGVNESRVIKRSADTPRVIMAYHCPDPICSESEKWYDGWRNLRQHYFRSHAEKNFVCDLCGFKTGLEKDLNYHRKVRCSWVKKRKSDEKKEKERCAKKTRRTVKRTKNSDDEMFQDRTPEMENQSSSTNTPRVTPPVFVVVSAQNVNRVIANIQKSLGSGTVLNFDSAEAGTQVEMPPYVDDEMIPMYNNTAATSTSFATQYEDPEVTFCERGTMMNDQEPLSYFSPPYGAEFGDMTPQPKGQQQFDYSVASTSTQPQTRSFGTMFENVETCNTGTSMIDESYVSEFLRDIETQTPSFIIQDAPSTGSSTAPSTSQNDWPWPS